MKEMSPIENVYLKDFGINVAPYLTYAQIQQIANAVLKQKTWAERQQNIDMLLLYHATDIDKKEFEDHSHNDFLQSGVIKAVKDSIVNLDQLIEAINFGESFQQILIRLVEKIGTNAFVGGARGTKNL